jgi:KaiC/GvpD/RAD55 family RecA-like ATPase/phage pi2 protein 07
MNYTTATSICVERVRQYLENLTDPLLKEKEPPREPVVGEDTGLITDIIEIKKGGFIVVAHTGAGKTTFGLTLYHKARRREIGSDVLYVNLREVQEKIGSKILNYNNLVRFIFNHGSKEYQELRKHIYSSLELRLECSDFIDCLRKFSTNYKDKKLILIFDELERATDSPTRTQLIVNMFHDIRKFYDETNLVPVKLVILYPKIMEVQHIKEPLEVASQAAAVFTEFRELKITDEILYSYLDNLANSVNRSFATIKTLPGFKRLIKVLATLQSGRYIFPKLQRAIAISLCSAVPQIGDNPEIIGGNTELKFVDIQPDDVIDKTVVGIATGRPFRAGETRSRSTIIEMWTDGIRKICSNTYEKIFKRKGIGNITKIGYQDFLCGSDDVYIWFSLKKKITYNDQDVIKDVIIKGLDLRQVPRNFVVIVLYPEYSTIRISSESKHSIKIEKEQKTKKEEFTFTFRQKSLTAEELISIAVKGGLHGFDTEIANRIIEELVSDIEKLIGIGK